MGLLWRTEPGPPRKRKWNGLRGERRRKGAGGGFAARRNRSRVDFAATSAVSKRVPRLYIENDREVERSLRLLL